LIELLNRNNWLKTKYPCRNLNVSEVLRIPSYAVLYVCVVRYCDRVSNLRPCKAATLETERARKSVPAVATFR
jgi:hypothetical protein